VPRTYTTLALLLLLPAAAPADEPDDMRRGSDALFKGDYDLAIAHFDAYIKKHPRLGVGFLNRGDAYAAKGQFARAAADYTECMRLTHKHEFIYRKRGDCYAAAGEYVKALDDYTEAIRLDPKSDLAYAGRAAVHLRKRDYRKAVADFREAARLDPDDRRPHNYLAWVLATCPEAAVRDGKKAVEHAKRACELSGWREGASLDTLAAAYAESGDYKEAVRWQRRALEVGFLGMADETEKARERLKLYEAGRPHRSK
jgi:tetratricopeptide (TPR) repeat protein